MRPFLFRGVIVLRISWFPFFTKPTAAEQIMTIQDNPGLLFWARTSEADQTEARNMLTAIITDNADFLVDRFYSTFLDHSEASAFLSHSVVSERLSHSL